MPTVKVNDRDVTVHDQAVFHALGPGDAFSLSTDGFFDEQYYYEYFKTLAKKEGQSLYEYLVGQFGEEEVKEYADSEEDLSAEDVFEMLKEFEGIDDIYNAVVQYKVSTDDTILPGDIVYMFPTWYPSRNYYGIYIVSLDKDGNKVLKNYGDGLYFDPITGPLLKQVMELNPNYFDQADSELWAYIGLEGQGTTQQAVKYVIGKMSGGRRKTRRNKRTLKQTRKNKRKN